MDSGFANIGDKVQPQSQLTNTICASFQHLLTVKYRCSVDANLKYYRKAFKESQGARNCKDELTQNRLFTYWKISPKTNLILIVKNLLSEAYRTGIKL